MSKDQRDPTDCNHYYVEDFSLGVLAERWFTCIFCGQHIHHERKEHRDERKR